MSKVIDSLSTVKLIPKEKINPISNIKIYGIYENAEYKLYIDKLIDLIETEGSIDIYSLFLALNSELVLNFEHDDPATSIVNAYKEFLIESIDMVGPVETNQRAGLCEKASNSFLNFILINLEEKYKAGVQDQKLIEESFLLSVEGFIEEFTSLNIKYDDRLKKDLEKIIAKFKHLHAKKMISNDQGEDQQTEEKTQEKKEKNNLIGTITESQKMQYKSHKWLVLLDKIEVLKKLVDEGRVFETAIVYEDIQKLLINFNPKEYFPEVFFPLYKKVAPEVKKIQQSIDDYSRSAQWAIAKNMYDVDYKSFLEDCEKMPENNVIGTARAAEHFYESPSQPLSPDKPENNALFDSNVIKKSEQYVKGEGRIDNNTKEDEADDDIFDF